MKTVDFKLTYMGDSVLLSRRSWEQIEKFLKAHGMSVKTVTKNRKAPMSAAEKLREAFVAAHFACEECGSTGEGGELEYADGSLKHFRNNAAWKDGKIHAVLCSGKFVPRNPTEGKP